MRFDLERVVNEEEGRTSNGVNDNKEIIRTHRKRGYQLIQPIEVEKSEKKKAGAKSFYFIGTVMRLVGGLILVLWKWPFSFNLANQGSTASEFDQFVEVVIDSKLSDLPNVTFTLLHWQTLPML